jgi:hypothetical protein
VECNRNETAGEWWNRFAGHAAYRKSVGFDPPIIVRGDSVQVPGVAILNVPMAAGERRRQPTEDSMTTTVKRKKHAKAGIDYRAAQKNYRKASKGRGNTNPHERAAISAMTKADRELVALGLKTIHIPSRAQLRKAARMAQRIAAASAR